MPTLQTLKNNAEAAAAAVAQLKQAYTGHRGLTSEQRALAEDIVARLTALRERYGTKSAEIDDIIQTISANAAAATDEAAARGEAPDFAALSAELDGLEAEIGIEDDAAVVPGRVAQQVQNIEQQQRQDGRGRIQPQLPSVQGQGVRQFPGTSRGGFRYSPKNRRRSPTQKFSPKKSKARRTSSKRKSASLRGGRKRTSHKTSRRTSRRTSRKKSHKRRRTSHRRNKH